MILAAMLAAIVGWTGLEPESQLAGRRLSEGYMQGKVALVCRWSLDSAEGREAVARLQRVWQSYKSKPFVALGSLIGGAGDAPSAKSFAKREGITLPLYREAGLEDGAPVFKQPEASEKRGPDMMTDVMAKAQWAPHSMGAGVVLPSDNVETLSAEGRAWLRREKREKHFLLQLLIVAVIYTLGGVCVGWAVLVLRSVWAILAKIGSVRWWLPFALVAAVLGGFWLWYALRALRIRRRFMKNLKRLCAEHGFQIEWSKRPYLSLFLYRSGANFRLHANGKIYDCKFFSAMRRHWEMYFRENGTLTTRRALRFRRVEFLRFSSVYEFDFESEHEKICIVAPVPNLISAGSDRWNRPIDTGTRVGKYRIFSSTGFLNALRRDCVEKE